MADRFSQGRTRRAYGQIAELATSVPIEVPCVHRRARRPGLSQLTRPVDTRTSTPGNSGENIRIICKPMTSDEGIDSAPSKSVAGMRPGPWRFGRIDEASDGRLAHGSDRATPFCSLNPNSSLHLSRLTIISLGVDRTLRIFLASISATT